MTTLTRYLLRSHAGPFAFAFAAVTGLLFLTAVAERFQELAGKGVGPAVILELLLLSLPHVVTLSVPMALFAATLYVFGDLSENSELLAMAAAGVHPGRLIAPLIVTGLALSLLMVGFNDRVLSWANARFQDRIEDVARKSPSVRLQAGAMTALHTKDGTLLFVSARSVDTDGSTLRGVTIADLSRPNRPGFVTAESASVATAPNQRDMVLRLTTGQLSSQSQARPGRLRWVEFQRFQLNLHGLAGGVERGERIGERAERELSISTLRARRREAQGAERFSATAELHRRYSTAFACLVFVLLAAPLGVRFAHAGIGAVIALSVVVLFFFRVGIIWGDRFSRAGRIDPTLGSWASVGMLFLIALLLLTGMGGLRHRTP